MTYLSRPHLVWFLLIPAAVSSLRLLSYPAIATQGERFTLSCIKDSNDFLKATWFRNDDIMFNTKSDIKNTTVSEDSQSILVVSGRITVSTSLTQHNVTLKINSTLDDGSVWVCRPGDTYSNNLTIHVIQHITGVSTFQTTRLQNVQTSTSADSSVDTTKDVQSNQTSTSTAGLSKEQKDKNLIYIVIGSVVGAVVVVSVIIVAIVCVIKKKRNETAQTKCPTPKEHSSVLEGGDGVDNSEMIENVLYCGYSDQQYSTVEENRSIGENKAQTPDETRVTDVYAQVQKKRNQTKVQVSVNIEDLYAKPVRKGSKDTANISVNNNVNINIGKIADEDV